MTSQRRDLSARPRKGRAHAAHIRLGPVAQRGQVAPAVEFRGTAAGVDSRVGRLCFVSEFLFFSFFAPPRSKSEAGKRFFFLEAKKKTKPIPPSLSPSLSFSHLVVVEPHKVGDGRLARGPGPPRGRDGGDELAFVEAAAARERPQRLHKLLEAQPPGGRVAARRAGLGEGQVDVRGRELLLLLPAAGASLSGGLQEPRGADELGEARAVDFRRCRRRLRRRQGEQRRDGGSGSRRRARPRGAAGSVGRIGQEHGSELLRCFIF